MLWPFLFRSCGGVFVQDVIFDKHILMLLSKDPRESFDGRGSIGSTPYQLTLTIEAIVKPSSTVLTHSYTITFSISNCDQIRAVRVRPATVIFYEALNREPETT